MSRKVKEREFDELEKELNYIYLVDMLQMVLDQFQQWGQDDLIEDILRSFAEPVGFHVVRKEAEA